MVKEPQRPSDAEKLWEVHQIARKTKELCQRLSKLFSCRGYDRSKATIETSADRGEMALYTYAQLLSNYPTLPPDSETCDNR